MNHVTGSASDSISRPGRRQFLVAGGATVVGAVVLGACSSAEDPVKHSGTTVTTAVPPTAPPPTSNAEQVAADKQLLRTATSFELLAAATYDKLLATKYVTDAPTVAALQRFGAQHTANAATLSEATTMAGGEAYDKPNTYLDENVITPAMTRVQDAASAVSLARQLEAMATSTYTQACSQLSTPKLRQAAMSVGGSAARRLAVLDMTVANNSLAAGAPAARQTVRDAIGNAALIK